MKVLGVTLLSFVIIFSAWFFLTIAPPQEKLASQMPQMLDAQVKKFKIHYVSSENISQDIQHAAIASQDKRFYSNLGVDSIGTFRAIYFSATSGKRQGASTITEQLGKNLYFSGTDNLKTDIETKVLALFLTIKYPKQYLLEVYLNVIYYGKGAYGISNASKTYFQTSPDKVTLAQAAYLLGLINAPSYLSDHRDLAIHGAKAVLLEMRNNNYISQSQESDADSQLESFK